MLRARLGGSRAAAARSRPTASASSRTCNAPGHDAGRGCRARRTPSSRRSAAAWAGPSPGTPRSAAEFNYDFHVSLDERVAPVEWNYRSKAELQAAGLGGVAEMDELNGRLGVSCAPGGDVLHTYSTYGRGVELAARHVHGLDLTPLGAPGGLGRDARPRPRLGPAARRVRPARGDDAAAQGCRTARDVAVGDEPLDDPVQRPARAREQRRRAGERRDGELDGAVVEQRHDERLLPLSGLPRPRAVGEPLAAGLVHHVHDPHGACTRSGPPDPRPDDRADRRPRLGRLDGEPPRLAARPTQDDLGRRGERRLPAPTVSRRRRWWYPAGSSASRWRRYRRT